ncbi:MAG: aryl-sulfate sulfotransferase [Terracidiphilus sp.]
MVTSPSAPTLSSSVSGTGNPLVASYSLTAPDQSQVKIQFGLTTDYGLETWLVPAPSGGGTVTILVAGMLQSSTYHMRAVVQLANSITIFDVDQTFQTGAIPADIPMPKFQVTASDTPPCAGVELVNLNPNNPVVTDLQGDIIWYYFNATDQAHKCHPMPLKPLTNGNMLVSCTNRYDGAKTPYCVLREVDLASKTVSGPNGPRELLMEDLNQRLENIKTPFGRTVQVNYYSHDVLPLSNGHVILLCQEFVNVNVGGTEILVWGDALVDLDDSYNPVWVWSAFDVLDINRHPFEWSPGAYDWTHCNAVQYTPDGNLLLSVRNQSWVLKLDYANGSGSGKILWTLGFEGDFAWNNLDTATWFFAQHDPFILETSDNSITQLALVDNGNYRAGTYPTPYSRGLILNIDETKMTAEISWQYPVSPNFFSFWGGNVNRLLNQNIEICMSDPIPCGSQQKSAPSFAVEVTVDQQEIWRMNTTPSNVYRSNRIPSLYPGVQW